MTLTNAFTTGAVMEPMMRWENTKRLTRSDVEMLSHRINIQRKGSCGGRVGVRDPVDSCLRMIRRHACMPNLVMFTKHGQEMQSRVAIYYVPDSLHCLPSGTAAVG